MNRVKIYVLSLFVLVLAGFVGLTIQPTVQHELTMRKDPIYATAYNDVIPLGYSMDEAYEIAGNKYYDDAKLLVEWYDYTFENAFAIRKRYLIAVGIEEALPYFDVFFVDIQYGDIAIIGSLNLDLLPERATQSDLTNGIATEIKEVYSGFRFLYIVFGLDPLNQTILDMQIQCQFNQPDFCIQFPISGELYGEYLTWQGPNIPLT